VAKNEPSKWRRIPKMSFSSKELSRRMKRVEGATIKHARRFVFKRLDNFREVRRRIALWVLAIGVIIGATGLQYMWYQDDYRTTAHATSGTYAEAVLGPVNTLNPIFAQSSAEETAGELLFSRLVTYDKSGKINYDLADNMTVSPDGKTYTLTIRPDARWDDGLYVRARDVVFTVNTLKNPASRSTITGWDNVIVKEIDSRTVAFELPAVYAAFPHALRFLPILPEHILRDVEPAALREDSFSSKPVGSGAFTLRLLQEVDAANGRKIVHLAKSESYFKGTPKLDRVQLHVYKDIDSVKRALATSEVNAATDLTITQSALNAITSSTDQ
jgi:peptide/nickel transport system substrate-binding protein